MAAIRGRTLQRSEPQGPNAVRIRAEDGKRRRETKAGKPVSSHGCSGISYPCGSAPAAEPETNPRTKRVRRIGRRRRGSERDGTKRFSERLGFRPSTPESSPRPAGAAAPPEGRASGVRDSGRHGSEEPQPANAFDRSGIPPRFAPRRKRKRKAGRFRPPSTAPASVPNLSRLTPGRQGRHAAPSRCLRRTDPIGRTSGGRPEDDNRKGAV